MKTQDVLFHRDGSVGRITLNRPKVLNALTLDMCAAMLDHVSRWARDPEIGAVVIDAVPGRAFCAGGDIRLVHEWTRSGDLRSVDLFRNEYRLNAAIKHFPKPYLSVLDGIVMGGGVGISTHGSHRIATERTVFAMPETIIGFFPDIGSSYFLSRLPGEIGMYLGLTGNRISAADMMYCGLATHYAPSPETGACVAALLRGDSWTAKPPAPSELKGQRAAIDRAFAGSDVESMCDALTREGEWGREIGATLAKRSPTSLKLTCRQLRAGRTMPFDECMRMEFRMTMRVLLGHDFHEGVRAAIIDKDQAPRWQPPGLGAVGEADIDAYFLPLEDELTL